MRIFEKRHRHERILCTETENAMRMESEYFLVFWVRGHRMLQAKGIEIVLWLQIVEYVS
jgi:hypothetical protein